MISSNQSKSTELTWLWNGKSYSAPLTAADVLMWARAIDEEGYPREGVAWALLQRWAWLRMNGSNYSLGTLVQAYAQPINPLWFPNGQLHQDEVERLKRIGDYSGAQAEENRAVARLRKAQQPWEKLEPQTRVLVADILAGRSTSPVLGAVHYWASRGPDFETNQKKRPNLILLDRGYGFGPGRNVFFAVNGSQRFGATLRVINGQASFPGNGDIGGGSGIIGPIAAVAVGFAFWKWLG